MKKIVVCMHVSVDGFVAGVNGEMNWIHVDEEIFNYVGEFTSNADTALYGRVTYEMMESYWPTAGNKPNASKHDIEHSNWYNGATKVVLSKTRTAGDFPGVKIISHDLPGEIKKLKQQEGTNIQIFGSPSAVHSLMQENLIDEYWLFVNPVLLGEGIPMFKNIGQKTKLKMVHSKAFSSGVVLLHYKMNN